MYGIKINPKYEENFIENTAKKYKIPLEDCYELDSTFIDFLYSLESSNYQSFKKDHYQPLQAMYFNKDGHKSAFLVNCYCGGFPNLKWNRDNILNTFPPQEQAPINDSLITLPILKDYIHALPFSDSLNTDEYNHVVVVHWNKFMGRQSKRLIQAVKKNVDLETEDKVKIIYVNNERSQARNARYKSKD